MKREMILFLIILLYPFFNYYPQNFWKSLGAPKGSNIAGIISLELKDNIVFAGTQGDGIYKTTDVGANWIKAINGPPQPWDIITDKYGNIFSASTWGVYKSTDDGDSWERVFFHSGYELWDIAINMNGEVYAGGGDNGTPYLFISQDQGLSWDTIPNNFKFFSTHAIGFDNYGNIYVGGNSTGNLYKSSDNGITWKDIDTANITGSIVQIFKNSIGNLFVSSINGFYKITENEQIIKLSNLTITPAFNITLGPQDYFFRFEQYNGLYSSADGINWILLSEELKDKYVLRMEFNSDGYLYIGCTNDTIYKSIAPIKNGCYYGNSYPYSNHPFCPIDEDDCPTNTIDPWNFYYRECTSYIAYKINEDAGFTSPPYYFTNNMLGGHWGNAGNWAQNAINLRYPVDNNPSVGSIAQWNAEELGSVGHVAFVEEVNSDGSVNLSEYNYHLDHNYNVRCNVNNVPRFIHINIPNNNFEVSLQPPNSISVSNNLFFDEIRLEQNRIVLSPYIYLNNFSGNRYHNIKVKAYLNNVPINVKLNTITRTLDGNNDGLIDSLPKYGSKDRFLVFTDPINEHIQNAIIKIVIEEIDGQPVNFYWEKSFSYYYAKTEQYNSFSITRDSYQFENLGGLNWTELNSLFSCPSIIFILPKLYAELRVLNGRCWGMSATVGKYFLYPETKPYGTNVFSWEPTDNTVTNSITMAHLNQSINFLNTFNNPNNEEEYQKLKEFLSEYKPVLFNLEKSGLFNIIGRHVVLCSSLMEINNKAFIGVYDSNLPYSSSIGGYYFFDYDISTKQLGTFEQYTYPLFEVFSNEVFQTNTNNLNCYDFINDFTDWLTTLNLKEISVGCPVNLLITNSSNQSYGFDANGDFINEISGCSFVKVPTADGAADSITIIYAPDNDEYQASVSSYDNGEMLFTYNKSNTQNQLISIYENNISITPTTQGYFDENNPNNQLSLDYNGDGQTDTTINLNQTITSIDYKENKLPTTFLLSQNYPNPFNPSTKINYSIPQSSFVTIKVYDILGKEVATLVTEEKQVGNYEINFDANNLSSGIYFYRIQAGNFSETKKLILLR